MPSVSKKQQRYIGMEYAKVKEGEKSETGMNQKELKKMASTSHMNLPEKAKGMKNQSGKQMVVKALNKRTNSKGNR